MNRSISLNRFKHLILTMAVTLFCNTAYTGDLVIASAMSEHLELQKSLMQIKKEYWKVSHFSGTELDLVEDIRLKATKSNLPGAALIPGATIRRWAALGFLKDLNTVSLSEEWQQRLPEQIYNHIVFQDRAFAVPTQVHRSNWMWMHKHALTANSGEPLDPPRTWNRFLDLANKAPKQNSFVIAVDQPEQNTIVFESLLLGLAGPEIYSAVFQEFDYKALRSDEMIKVFDRFAELRPFLAKPQYATWPEGATALKNGHGGVLFAGDWVKPFFNSAKGSLSPDILCEPYPEASATFLFNLNSVVMFKDTQKDDAETLADLLFSETLLTELNLTEGSIPARLDVSPYGFDRCGVRAMREFRSSHSINTLNPSLAAGMAAPELVQRKVYNAINAFIANPTMTSEQGAKELAKAIRVALYKI